MGQTSDELTRGSGRSLARNDDVEYVETYETTSVYADEDDDGTEEIRVEIEQTRVELSETIDAIQERLNPQVLKDQAMEQIAETKDHIVDQAKEAVREATIGRAEHMVQDASDTVRDTGFSVLGTISRNPIPSALVGLGLAWMFMGGKGSSSNGQRYVYPQEGTPFYGGARSRDFDAYGRGDQSGSSVGRVAGQAQDAAGRIADRAQDAAGQVGDTAMGAGSSLLETIQQNPIPAALAGLSLGWLYMNSQGGSSRSQYRGYDRSRQPYDYYGEQRGSGSGMLGQAQGMVGSAAGTAQGAVGSVAGTAQSAVGQVAGTAQSAVGDLADTAQSTVGDFADTVQGAPSQLERMVRENPLGMGAVALGIGAAVGLAMPSMPVESQLMGSARDRVLDQAQEVVRDAGQKVQRVAEEAGHAAQREAKAQNLTAGA